MFASSPSPKNISTYSSSNNGSNPLYSPRHLSPRFVSTSRSPRLHERLSPSRLSSRSAKDYSTSSPLSNPIHTSPSSSTKSTMASATDQSLSQETAPNNNNPSMTAKTTPSFAVSTNHTGAKVPSDITSTPTESKRRQPSFSQSTSPTALKKSKPQMTVKALPIAYEHCATEDMVVLIADMIGELIEVNDKLKLDDDQLTRYHSR